MQFAAQQGANLRELIATTAVDVDMLLTEDCRVSAEVYNRVVDLAVSQTQNQSLGFHFGSYMNLAGMGLVGQITQTSATIGEALGHVCAFSNLGCQAIPMSVVFDREGAFFQLEPNTAWQASAPEVVRHTAEGMLLYMWRVFQSLTFHQYKPLRVTLQSAEQHRQAEFAAAFGYPVLFDQPRYALLLRPKHLEEPVLGADFRLLQVLVRHAEAKLAAIAGQESFLNSTRKAILHLMSPSFPTINAVAESMNMSVRTLQRKLKMESVTFKEIIEEVRKSFAYQYLEDQALTIGEVSELLNYAEVSAFSRSFKRWEGVSPQQYRDQLCI